MAAADADQRLALIKENLAEVLNEEIIKKILDEGRHPKIYWGRLPFLTERERERDTIGY